MKIGLTCDGLVKSAMDVSRILGELGHTVTLMDSTVSMVQRLAQGDRWDFVLNCSKGGGRTGSQTQIPTVLEAFRIPYSFTEPLPAALAVDTRSFCAVVSDLGLPVCASHWRGGRDYTVAMVGSAGDSSILAIQEVVGEGERDGEFESRVRALALHAWRVLTLRDAGTIRICVDANGIPYLRSVEPIVTFNPQECDWTRVCLASGMSFDQLVRTVFQRSIERCGLVATGEITADAMLSLESRTVATTLRSTRATGQ